MVSNNDAMKAAIEADDGDGLQIIMQIAFGVRVTVSAYEGVTKYYEEVK